MCVGTNQPGSTLDDRLLGIALQLQQDTFHCKGTEGLAGSSRELPQSISIAKRLFVNAENPWMSQK